MGDLLQFQRDRCRAPRRGRRRKDAPTAQVCVVPTSRHRKIVAFIVGQMRKKRSLRGAEEALADHLWIEVGRLDGLGISDDDIDRFTRDFARVAWVAFFKDRETRGIA